MVSAQKDFLTSHRCLTSLRCLPSLRSVRQLSFFSMTAENETLPLKMKQVFTSVPSLGLTFLGRGNIHSLASPDFDFSLISSISITSFCFFLRWSWLKLKRVAPLLLLVLYVVNHLRLLMPLYCLSLGLLVVYRWRSCRFPTYPQTLSVS